MDNKERLEQIDDELNKLYEHLVGKSANPSSNKSYDQYLHSLEPELSQINALENERRTIQEPVLGNEVGSNDHLMTIAGFVDSVIQGDLNDYDGYGEYILDNRYTGIHVNPSDVERKCMRMEFTHIVWFNR
jgi:hypothetical protein